MFRRSLAIRYSVVMIAVAGVLGCRDAIVPRASPPAATLAFERFNPIDDFRGLGYDAKLSNAGGRVCPSELYAWKTYYGTLVSGDESSGCDLVCKAIRDCLDSALDHGTIEGPKPDVNRKRGAPMFQAYRYRFAGRRGTVYVWLYPNEPETQFNFAILLHEICVDHSL